MQITSLSNSSPLEELPTELFVEVLSYLAPIRGFDPYVGDEEFSHFLDAKSTRDLHSMALVSRRCNIVTTPVLYQAVVEGVDLGAIRLFLRTLLDRPELGRYIQYIEMLHDFSTDEIPCRRTRAFDLYPDSDWQLFFPYLSRFTSPPPFCNLSTLMSTGVKNTEHADQELSPFYLEAFWNHCPARFEIGCLVVVALAENLIEAALPNNICIPFLACQKDFRPQRLRRLWYIDKDDPAHYHTNLVFSAREACLKDNLNWLKSGGTRKASSKPLLSLNKLTLEGFGQGLQGPNIVRRYLQSCKEVEHLFIDWVDFSLDIDHRDLLYKDLKRFKSKLKSLTLRFGYLPTESPTIIPVGSLRDLQVLRHLQVTDNVLFGLPYSPQIISLARMLPPSLEKLAIHIGRGPARSRVRRRAKYALRGLADDCTALTPHLKNVILHIQCHGADRLQKAFNNVGVEFEVRVGLEEWRRPNIMSLSSTN